MHFLFFTPYTQHFFSIDFPVELIPQGESGSKDGQIFKSNNAELRAYRQIILNKDADWAKNIQEAYASTLKLNESKRITYKTLGKDFFVISGFENNGRIFYKKTICKKYGIEDKTFVRFITAILSYEESEREHYDKMIKHVFASLK
jgi:hypothetical protein